MNIASSDRQTVADGNRTPSSHLAKTLISALSRDAFDLLGLIIRERPCSVDELARLAGRAAPNVTRTLTVLTGLGLIRMVRVGLNKRPEPIVAALYVDLRTGRYETVPLESEAA